LDNYSWFDGYLFGEIKSLDVMQIKQCTLSPLNFCNSTGFYFMQKLLSIFLAFLVFTASLMPKLDLEEFAKIPRLVAHYNEHSKINENLNFLDFLSHHYQTSHKNSPEHEGLPFVSHQAGNIVFVLNEIKLLILTFINHQPHYFAFSVLHFISISGKSLFQPPKV